MVEAGANASYADELRILRARLADLEHERDRRERFEREIRTNEERLFRQGQALSSLTVRQQSHLDDVHVNIADILETTSRALDVARSSVWLYGDERQSIRCLDLFDGRRFVHLRGMSLKRSDFPKYFAAMESSLAIAADDARTDPRTKEFGEVYLTPEGITSMLDTPIRVRDETFGVLCNEHVGPPRKWTLDEQNFAIAAANLVSLALEIDQRRRAENALKESEFNYRSLYESTSQAVLLQDEREFIDCNEATLRLFGCAAKAEVNGKRLWDFSAPIQPSGEEARALAERFFAEAVRIGSCRFDWVCRRVDGTTFPADILLTVISLADRRVIQSVIQDISERKRTERELEAAMQAAEAANHAKSQFLANMSHEIRTPLNAIIGMTDLALDIAVSRELREYLETVKASGELLYAVINDILDFSKIEAGKMLLDSSPFSLREEFGNTVKMLALGAHRKGIEVCLRVDPRSPDALIGDPVRLRQIVVNLLGNAIKFTERGEIVVEVAATPISEAEAQLRIDVRDTGIGIPKDKLEAIFDAFVQEDSTVTRRYGGTGLGLAIAAQLTRLMKGGIWVESAIGQGSVFHIEVTFGLGSAARRLADGGGLAGKTVLIVDDNATSRANIEEVLTNWKMVPTAVSGMREAAGILDAARGQGAPFGFALIDADMSDSDGVEFAARVAKTDGLAEKTILMIAAGADPDPVAQCRALGISSYLLKPIKESELLRVLTVSGDDLGLRSETVRPSSAKAAGSRLRILLAEDNAFNQKLAIGLLEKEGHAVTVANNGLEVLAAAEAESFDLILMDVQMPMMDGLVATSELRRREAGSARHTPIIAMTAHSLPGDRERCLAAGMDGYLSKPVRPAELHAAISTIQPAAVADPIEPSSIEPQPSHAIDRDALLSSIGGEPERLLDLINLFKEERANLVARMVDVLGGGQLKELARLAHTLKGAVSILTTGPSLQAVVKLEACAKAGDQAEAKAALEALETALGGLNEELDRIAGECNSRKSTGA